jgi:aldose 1-epimerase
MRERRNKMAFQKEVFGQTKDKKTAYLYTVENKNGVTAKFTDFGAILVALEVPDKDGKTEDVVLGFEKLEDYFVNDPNFGATIGRHANRIGGAAFTLNGKTYELDKNDGKNNLHGGFNGYHKRLWEAKTGEEARGQVIEFTYHSPDGDQGFPGNLDISVKYILTEDNALIIEYNATPDKDTVINLTNHSYFNLAGQASGTILDQIAWIDSDEFTFADEESIPNGEIRKTAGTPMDFTTPKKVGVDIAADYDQLNWGKGFDHNWILKTKKGTQTLVASLYDEKSGRYMEVYTDLPGIQFYTGNFLDGTLTGKNGAVYIQRSGLCFETQYFPNAINVPSFDQPVTKAGELYHTETMYKFTVK